MGMVIYTILTKEELKIELKSYNSMKTKITLLFLSLLFTLHVSAQQAVYHKAHHDLAPFTGTWIATKDDMKYEITFKKGINKVKLNEIDHTLEVVYASVKWYKNESLIREKKIDGPNSILNGFVAEEDPLFLSMIYTDKEKGYNGSGTFTIDNAKNPQKAKWTHHPTSIGKNRGKTDFPYILEFIKIK